MLRRSGILPPAKIRLRRNAGRIRPQAVHHSPSTYRDHSRWTDFYLREKKDKIRQRGDSPMIGAMIFILKEIRRTAALSAHTSSCALRQTSPA